MKKFGLFLLAIPLVTLLITPFFLSEPKRDMPKLVSPVSVFTLKPGTYEIKKADLVGNQYRYVITGSTPADVHFVVMPMGRPSPMETVGTKFSTDGKGTIEFDVSTEGIPLETTKPYVPIQGDLILDMLTEGDYEILEITNKGPYSPDGKTTTYVYRLRDLKTQKVVLTIFRYPTGYVEKVGKKFRFKRLPNGNSISEDLP